MPEVTFLNKKELTHDIAIFYFEKKEFPYNFSPGQYTKITFNSTESRFFTISASPLDDIISITTRKGTSYFKQALFALAPGTKVLLDPPMGGFYLDETDTKKKVFLAGGLGMTPFYSMLRYLDQKNIDIDILLFISISDKQDMVYTEELRNYMQKHPSITVVYTYTGKEPVSQWQGEVGRISSSMIKKYIPNTNKYEYWIVGSASFTVGMESLLTDLHISSESIQMEIYT